MNAVHFPRQGFLWHVNMRIRSIANYFLAKLGDEKVIMDMSSLAFETDVRTFVVPGTVKVKYPIIG